MSQIIALFTLHHQPKCSSQNAHIARGVPGTKRSGCSMNLGPTEHKKAWQAGKHKRPENWQQGKYASRVQAAYPPQNQVGESSALGVRCSVCQDRDFRYVRQWLCVGLMRDCDVFRKRVVFYDLYEDYLRCAHSGRVFTRFIWASTSNDESRTIVHYARGTKTSPRYARSLAAGNDFSRTGNSGRPDFEICYSGIGRACSSGCSSRVRFDRETYGSQSFDGPSNIPPLDAIPCV